MAKIKQISLKIKQDNRKPSPLEVESLANYNNSLVDRAQQMIQINEESKSVPRKLTSLERGQLAIKFIRMNEKPNLFMLNNRFIERSHRDLPKQNMSEFQIKKKQLQKLIE